MTFTPWVAATRLALVTLLAMAGAQAHAAGALAIDTLQGEKYGFSFNHPSSDLAEKRSLRECGADCSIVLRFRAECAAYAADQTKGSNAYGWGSGATSAAVQQRAMSECRAKGGDTCKVRAWGCDAIKASAEPEPAAKETKPASTEVQMQGEWRVEYTGSAGFPYSGSLRLGERQGDGSYRGVMVLSFTNNAGTFKRVQQNATATVQGNTVVIRGSNPVYLVGSGNYDADTFTTSVAGPTTLRGKNDEGAGGGSVVISR
jgi:hypothetical protein